MVKLKEEYDYKSLSRRLEKEIDRLVIENERQTKAMLGAEGLEKAYEEVNYFSIVFLMQKVIQTSVATSASHCLCSKCLVWIICLVPTHFSCSMFLVF